MADEVRHSRALDAELIIDPELEALQEVLNGLKQFRLVVEMVESFLGSERPFKLRPSHLQQLHRVALTGLSAYAGNWRPSGIEIRGSGHAPPDPSLIPELVEELCDYVTEKWTEKSPLHLASYVMWKLNWIHPFTDGNGRTSRAVSYLILCLRLGYLLPGKLTIPEQISIDKRLYYKALEAADLAWTQKRIDLTAMKELLGSMLAAQLVAIHEDSQAGMSAAEESMSSMLLSPSEDTMWMNLKPEHIAKLDDDEINAKYLKRELRIVTEMNREQLPNFVEALKRTGWMDVRPFYQRRPRWEASRQSKLIESFVMNVPIPPLFVYESDYAKYEVMDGQQRISAIRDFYANKLVLEGLEQWPELNGRIYDKLPSEIKKGIDRRSISYIVLLKESAVSTEDETLLRQQVFERLNTGGIKLSNQEIRNSIYNGPFNRLLLQVVKSDIFRSAWGIPRFTTDEDTRPSDELLAVPLYSQMRDVEIALRFFALRHASQYRRGMSGFLDLYSVRARHFTDDDVAFLKDIFERTLSLASAVYGDLLFKPWDRVEQEWSKRPQVAFADAVMVGLSRHLEKRYSLLGQREKIIDATKKLFELHDTGTFTGQRNTKKDVEQRIDLFDKMLVALSGD
jgi:fido (protein-threonine AMPylation protein)